MPIIRTTTSQFWEVFPALAKLWPVVPTGWTPTNLQQVTNLLKPTSTKTAAATARLSLNTQLSRRQLLRSAGSMSSVPSPYEKYFGLGNRGLTKKVLNQTALKLRPGAQVGLILEGFKTTARINSIRRTEFQGSPNWVKAEMLIDVSHIPLYLEQETKCTCRYCGYKPKGPELECPKCGAPLPDC